MLKNIVNRYCLFFFFSWFFGLVLMASIRLSILQALLSISLKHLYLISWYLQNKKNWISDIVSWSSFRVNYCLNSAVGLYLLASKLGYLAIFVFKSVLLIEWNARSAAPTSIRSASPREKVSTSVSSTSAHTCIYNSFFASPPLTKTFLRSGILRLTIKYQLCIVTSKF